MDEFLRINWRLKDLSAFEPHEGFIREDVISESLVYKSFEAKSIFASTKQIKNLRKHLGDHVPGSVNIDTMQKSVLDEWAHEQCLNALQIFKSGKDSSRYTTKEQFAVDIFNQLKSRILEENVAYENYARFCWTRQKSKKLTQKLSSLVSYGQLIWEAKWKRLTTYPQFYKEVTTVNLNFDENQSVIEFKCISNVLDLGAVAKFTQPNLKSICFLGNTTLPKGKNKLPNCKLPVSEDKNVTNILESRSDIDLVISFSGLKCISDISDPKRKWMIPIVVKKVPVQIGYGSTTFKNVVFVNKPFSRYDVSDADLAYISYKRLIKTNFCQVKAFSYSDTTAPDSESQINYDDAYTDVSSNCSIDVAEDTRGTIHHNAGYKVWNIKKTSCQNNLMKTNNKNVELNVLIRNKLDAVECVESGALQPLILRPKLEHQVKFGARVPSLEELAKDWTSLFFIPFSSLYRVGVKTTSTEVLYTQKCTIQKIAAEAQTHYQYRPQLSLGILQRVFEELVKLEPGSYLLQHLPKHEAFVAILTAVDGPNTVDRNQQNEPFDLHAELNNITVNIKPTSWLPIDVNFILPSFLAAKRMPGMFTPSPVKKNKKFIKGKRKKAATETTIKKEDGS